MAAPPPGIGPDEILELHVRIVEARGLRRAHSIVHNEPFATLRCRDELNRSAAVKHEGTTPTFDFKSMVHARLADNCAISIVHEGGVVSSETVIGAVVFAVSDLADGQVADRWLSLHYEGQEAGEVRARMQLMHGGERPIVALASDVAGAVAAAAAAAGAASTPLVTAPQVQVQAQAPPQQFVGGVYPQAQAPPMQYAPLPGFVPPPLQQQYAMPPPQGYAPYGAPPMQMAPQQMQMGAPYGGAPGPYGAPPMQQLAPQQMQPYGASPYGAPPMMAPLGYPQMAPQGYPQMMQGGPMPFSPYGAPMQGAYPQQGDPNFPRPY